MYRIKEFRRKRLQNLSGEFFKKIFPWFCQRPIRIFGIGNLFPMEIISRYGVSGGSINNCFKIETRDGIFFLKENSAEKFPGMFEAEARGLELLRKANAFCIPQVILLENTKNNSRLFLEWLERKSSGNWREAGALLAELHKNTAEFFGLDHSNYIGSLPQSNSFKSSWADFFTSERILPQLKMAYENGRADKALLKQGESFCSQVKNIFPEEKPALLHGDLWSGNFFFCTVKDRAAFPSVFDPAVYYGHREMDLAMTKLFGGFDAEFYEGYEDEFPLEKNWRERIDCCNLYPLLVHVNLFGGGYVQEVKNILNQF
jgi:fructosamine-3-kinase